MTMHWLHRTPDEGMYWEMMTSPEDGLTYSPIILMELICILLIYTVDTIDSSISIVR